MNKVRANQIVAKALQTRKKYLNIGAYAPICPYNLAEAMGFDIRFVNIPSFEGMYIADDGVILISADRPEGRKRFTCAHEIGHHVLGHGTVIDEIIESGSDKDIEKEADFFAGILLMSSSALKRVSVNAGIDINLIDGKQAYMLSKYFGVSYTALVTQLYFNLKLIDRARYERLRKISLEKIKLTLSPIKLKNQIVVVDSWWVEKAVDIEVGDIILSKNDYGIDGVSISKNKEDYGGFIYKAEKPGISRIYNSEWASFVRVSKKKFSGLLQYRYEEEIE